VVSMDGENWHSNPVFVWKVVRFRKIECLIFLPRNINLSRTGKCISKDVFVKNLRAFVVCILWRGVFVKEITA
jgi:hypothetical protein